MVVKVVGDGDAPGEVGANGGNGGNSDDDDDEGVTAFCISWTRC